METTGEYLKEYGYLSSPESNRKAVKLNEGITMFQKFNGLKETGRLNPVTMEQMNKPRCGMHERMDLMENEKISTRTLTHKIPRRRRWGKSRIFYKVHNFPYSGLHPTLVRKEIRRAFRLWEGAANIEFVELAQDEYRMVDINISFESGEHGDNAAFGSTIGNVAAHAYFPDHPYYRGNIHFDNSRLWTAYNLTEINLFQAACHEIGHALGLDHSRFPESVMFMNLHSKLEENFQLHPDDIKGIRNLYGSRRGGNGSMMPHSRTTNTRMPKVLRLSTTPRSSTDDLMSPRERISGDKIKVDVDLPELGTTVTNFWNCFQFSYNPETSKKANNCFAKNALGLLYSIKM
ncbi:Matrix metalloproteinase-14 [Orchesella cincta]|uniref:Matrix metalloproteinase-14 n=1 Tax=Orchesella cincta TaxID=48709 RepID=A0A1D2MUF4_ORCCI|nr:Matrix metalloproteinase-14 [Orchesella cincta]